MIEREYNEMNGISPDGMYYYNPLTESTFSYPSLLGNTRDVYIQFPVKQGELICYTGEMDLNLRTITIYFFTRTHVHHMTDEEYEKIVLIKTLKVLDQ